MLTRLALLGAGALALIVAWRHYQKTHPCGCAPSPATPAGAIPPATQPDSAGGPVQTHF